VEKRKVFLSLPGIKPWPSGTSDKRRRITLRNIGKKKEGKAIRVTGRGGP
jgi:hypothetical protein